MRWYKIEVGGEKWDATNDPYALNVEFDIPVTQDRHPTSGCFARIWGIPLQTIQSARKFNNQPIKVYGGMQKGLPLADPSQQGLLVQGKVYPALGNWVGTDMTLDFNIAYSPSGLGVPNFGQPTNTVHDWPANTWLGDAMKKTIKRAYPLLQPVINISKDLKLPYNDDGFYQTLGQWTTYIYSISKTIKNDKNYYGVHTAVHGDKIYVFDGTEDAENTNIKFTDLVGQPIWIDINRIQVKTIMRGDLRVGKNITMPQTFAGLGGGLSGSGGAINQSSASNVIQGKFLVQAIRHTGNFRQPDGLSWITTIEAIQLKK